MLRDHLLSSMQRYPLAWVLGLILFFLTFPSVDLIVAALSYDPDTGFPNTRGPGLEFFRMGIPMVVYGMLMYCVAIGLAAKWIGPPLPWLGYRQIAFLMTSLFIGPGVAVNLILKELWGRARPSQITEFGGEAMFTPPVLVTDQCVSNCAFVSGHAALGFWTVALALLVPLAHRNLAVAAALGFGFAVGVSRIVVGAHFLSDVLFSGLIVTAITFALYRWIVGGPTLHWPNGTPPRIFSTKTPRTDG